MSTVTVHQRKKKNAHPTTPVGLSPVLCVHKRPDYDKYLCIWLIQNNVCCERGLNPRMILQQLELQMRHQKKKKVK